MAHYQGYGEKASVIVYATGLCRIPHIIYRYGGIEGGCIECSTSLGYRKTPKLNVRGQTWCVEGQGMWWQWMRGPGKAGYMEEYNSSRPSTSTRKHKKPTRMPNSLSSKNDFALWTSETMEQQWPQW